MRVSITLQYYQGRALFKDDPHLAERFDGVLRIREERIHKHRRVVLVAHLLNNQDGKEVKELNDVTLLWVNRRYTRIRGFEYEGDTEYAQTWDIEFL